jgi:micrococcal nuclease
MGVCHSTPRERQAALDRAMAVDKVDDKVDDNRVAMLDLANLDDSKAVEPTYEFTRAKVLSVYDGDTITIGAIVYGVYTKFSVRLYGIDCAEMRGGTAETKALAERAKLFVEYAILGKVVEIQVLNGKIHNGKKIREKYGRLLALVSMPDGRDLSEALLAAGLAKKYDGGKKG